jgi:NAD(P)-dependent dehydrogenase (short-subunit alcohol dehydrogenase family)
MPDPLSLFNLGGKNAIVTGSTRGIGKAIARWLALAGARVVVSSRKADACDQVAEEINDEVGAGSAVAVACNIGHKEQLQNLVDKTHDALGPIHIAVGNAAVNPFFGSALDIPDSAFEKVMHSNITSNHWLAQMVIPEMRERKWGRFIIVSSVAGVKGTPMLGAYAISKAADMQMARNLAREFGPDGITVNCIAPGLIKTDFSRALWEDQQIHDRIMKTMPLGRIGTVDEVAGYCVYLASDAGGFTTGQSLVIDGGASI